MYDDYGDGWNGVMFAIYDLIQDSMLVTTTLDTGSASSAQFLIGDYDQLGGCMDQSAINFDSEAILMMDHACIKATYAQVPYLQLREMMEIYLMVIMSGLFIMRPQTE